MACGDAWDGFAQDIKVVSVGVVVAGGGIEPYAFAGVVKGEGYAPVWFNEWKAQFSQLKLEIYSLFHTLQASSTGFLEYAT